MTSAFAFPFGKIFAEEIDGSGVVRQESRDLEQFSAMSVDIPVLIELKAGARSRVSISADDNLLPFIAMSVNNGALSVSTPNKKIRPSHPVSIVIETNNLHSLSVGNGATVSAVGFPLGGLQASITGGANLKLDSLDMDNVSLTIAGNGTFSGTGKVNSFSISTVGRGRVDAGRLEAQHVNASVSGFGDVVVWVVGGMNVQTIGPGAVKYYGDAAVSGKAQRLGSAPAL